LGAILARLAWWRPRRRRRSHCHPFWLPVLIGSLAVFAALVPAALYAIADPDTINIEEIRAYDSVLESGDLLIIAEYNLAYAVTPTDTITDTYLGRFKRGSTELNTVEPYAFNDNGFGRGLFSLYWTAAQKSTDSIEFDNPNSESYTVTLQGKVGSFPGVVPSTTTDTILWQAAANTKDQLFRHIQTLAARFENDAGWEANSQNLITTGGGAIQLTASGEEYFSNAVPQLHVMIPAIFSSGVSVPDFTESPSRRSLESDLDNFWEGNWVDTRFSNLATTMRVDKNLLTALVAFFLT